jgi:tetratricopeptide (TPR) repeat protein
MYSLLSKITIRVQMPFVQAPCLKAKSRRSNIWVELALAILVAAVTPSAALAEPKDAMAERTEDICDVNADYALGREDYPLAIRLHRHILKTHRASALAHYHLGFAYRMVGNLHEELREYSQADELGLREWHFFQNYGIARLENGEAVTAVALLQKAVLLAPDRADTHFDLSLGYKQTRQLEAALQEIEESLRIEPGQPDARNARAIIKAEIGHYEEARRQWRELSRDNPEYSPALQNLQVLDRLVPLASEDDSIAW